MLHPVLYNLMNKFNPFKKSSGTHSIPFYRDERFLKFFAQAISTIAIISFIAWLGINFQTAAAARGLTLTYDFLSNPAGFPISDPTIAYDPSMSFGRAFLVGLMNTLKVSVIGILIATILGTAIALARLSSNWLLSKIAFVYIEFHRNIPLLVLLIIWKNGFFSNLPSVSEAMEFPGPIYLSQRGFYFTWPRLTETGPIFASLAIAGIILAFLAYKILRKKREISGKETYYIQISAALFLGFHIIGWFAAGAQPFWLDVPVLSGYNFDGGMRITPEFAALLIGLTMYTAGFIAEVVRAGIQAVDRGQVEAAKALGLSTGQVLSLVVMPQALLVIIPPMISQYLNLTKNSSLALAIGYMDFFSIGKITINQAGRAVPVIILVMAVYLALSLFTSLVLNIYNRRIQFVTR